MTPNVQGNFPKQSTAKQTKISKSKTASDKPKENRLFAPDKNSANMDNTTTTTSTKKRQPNSSKPTKEKPKKSVLFQSNQKPPSITQIPNQGDDKGSVLFQQSTQNKRDTSQIAKQDNKESVLFQPQEQIDEQPITSEIPQIPDIDNKKPIGLFKTASEINQELGFKIYQGCVNVFNILNMFNPNTQLNDFINGNIPLEKCISKNIIDHLIKESYDLDALPIHTLLKKNSDGTFFSTSIFKSFLEYLPENNQEILKLFPNNNLYNKINLTCITLTKEDLSNKNFINCDFTNAKFTEINFLNTKFIDSKMNFCSTNMVNFDGTIFMETNLNNMTMTNTNCTNAVFFKSHMSYQNFFYVSFTYSIFIHSPLQHPTLTKTTDLDDAIFINSSVTNQSLANTENIADLEQPMITNKSQPRQDKLLFAIFALMDIFPKDIARFLFMDHYLRVMDIVRPNKDE